MKIEIQKLTEQEITEKGIRDWSVWEKEVSKFDWYYDATEYCLILEGKVKVTTEIEEVNIEAGDYVKFPQGLSCKWDITSDIRKHYLFE